MARFLQEHGFESFEADFSPEMLSQSRRKGSSPGRAVVGDLHGLLPYRDDSFDLVLCWRFLHHLPGLEAVESIMSELARVTHRWVIVSFFHPLSFHNLQRKVRTLLGGNSGCRYPHKPGMVQDAARVGGLELKWTAAQLPYLKDLWAAVFVKQAKG
jgi:ubiquinone/menaquinone biosynthesis C-methylase UbiE